MTPEMAEFIYPILNEFNWLNSEQHEDLIRLAMSLEGQRIDIALGQLCSRSLRFAVENYNHINEPAKVTK